MTTAVRQKRASKFPLLHDREGLQAALKKEGRPMSLQDTSRAALAALKPADITRKHWMILCYLGNHGMACAKRMMAVFGWETNQSGRFSELKGDERLPALIEDSGQRIEYDGRRHAALILTRHGADILSLGGFDARQRRLF